ncbi:MAG: hypothetical protein P8N58_04750 [Emcibacteraceae bacterium]|nr:hypothetical protein [Emcibacteraceae bacterium]
MKQISYTNDFMGLLKAFNYVPDVVRNEIEYPENISNLVEHFKDLVKSSTEDYDFIKLLVDKGHVPVNDNWKKVSINLTNVDINKAS